MAECRICQEEDDVLAMEAPCSCNGTLKVITFLFRVFNLFSHLFPSLFIVVVFLVVYWVFWLWVLTLFC